MDGFSGTRICLCWEPPTGPEILDLGWLRPGRFDRRIPVGLLDRKCGRTSLRLYAQNSCAWPLAASLNQKRRSWTPGGLKPLRRSSGKRRREVTAQARRSWPTWSMRRDLAAAEAGGPVRFLADNRLYTVTLEDMLEALENMIVGLPSRKIPGAQG